MVATIVFGTFITILSSTMLATAYPALMKAFDASTSTVQWLTTGFMMVNGVMIPITAWLLNRFSSRTLYMTAMSLFLVGTILAFVASDFSTIFIGRLIQGIAVGITMPLAQTVNLSIFPPEKRGTIMGILGLAIGMAPAIGPTLSGFIIDSYSWRMLFGMLIPFIIVVIIISFFTVKTVIPTSKSSLDWWSAALSTAGFGSMLYGFSEVGDKGWTDPLVISTIIIGIIIVAFFVIRQLKSAHPFLNLTVFKTRTFSLTTTLSAIVNIAMVGVEMVLPIYLQTIRGDSALQSGLTLLPGALMIGVMSPITGRIFDKIGAKRLAITGLTLLTLGTIPFLFLTKETPLLFLIITYAIRMVGVAMALMPITTSGMNSLPLNLVSHATAVNNTVRQVASSMGTAILVSVLSNVTKNSMPGKSLLASMPLLYKEHATNAVLTGYAAAFSIAVVFSVAGLIIAFFLNDKNTVNPLAGGEK
ncbi:MDR family MFS transporter [Lentilactobacillus sp. SPB1-3]|uniref:MDR family MFS transporter n=1 Tax=Lentilactobacillus terminaliae TaxID=3003483 RepID=A0ACD5DHE4_9LACO|nr:MDR family MFS transporter [Lentilactobacillus sp. SPB1-3]